MKKKYLWLFGENNGNTMNNNSFYFWKQVVNSKDEIEKYYVVSRNTINKKIIKTLSRHEKKYIVWQNSFAHWKLFLKSNLLFVSLSYKDVMPSKILFKSCDMKLKKPLIYFQHGTLAMKKLGYDGKSYNNNMFKFIIYNKSILEQFSKENDFNPYQLYYGEYHPRYKELVKKEELYEEKNQILWFITWREVFDKSYETTKFLKSIKRVIENEKIKQYQKDKNCKIKICLHTLFDEKQVKYLKENINCKDTEIVYSSKIDVMDEIAKSKLLITDYSSLGFDFTFLNKPVILYQPDLDSYLANRDIYCTIDELNEYNVKTPKDLVEKLLKDKFEINNFFRKRLPENLDHKYVKEGKHIEKMYDSFKKMQINNIVFLGYNFYGRGGTISATFSLAEALLEKGYLVQLLSLKQTNTVENISIPYGLNLNSIYMSKRKRKIELLKRLFRFKFHYSYLNYDSNRANLIPYTGFGLKNYLKRVKANTVISTRETIHMFLKTTKSNNIKNKVYFFHTDGNTVNNIFPGVIDKINKMGLEKCAFVTEVNRKVYETKLNFTNYEKYSVVGNSLSSTSIIKKDEVEEVSKKDKYNGIYLLRISKDRKNDLLKCVEFGIYLKENKINNIKINVFGTGDYVDEFENMLYDNDLDDYIEYKGLTTEPKEEMSKNDFLVDFSYNQSFGMTYIEGILNGLSVFAYKNYGSTEVLKGIDNCFIESFEDLVNKINNIPSISKSQLQKNYDIIIKKYSREIIADKIIKLIEE